MPAPNKIEKYEFQDEILKLSAQPGMTTHRIAEILTEKLEGRDTISQPTVSRWLKGERELRGEQTRAIVQDHIKEAVPEDLKALEEIEAWLLGIYRNQMELVKARSPELLDDDPELKALTEKLQGDGNEDGYSLDTRINAAMKAVKIIELKLKYAGILEDPDARPKHIKDIEDEDLEEKIKELMKK